MRDLREMGKAAAEVSSFDGHYDDGWLLAN